MKNYIGFAKNALKIGAFFVPATAGLGYANIKAIEMQDKRIKAQEDEYKKNGISYKKVTNAALSSAKGSLFVCKLVPIDPTDVVNKVSSGLK
jgi:hypothetical protein